MHLGHKRISITTPRWFQKICHRSPQPSSPNNNTISPLMYEFEQLYQMAKEEITYATDSQTSCYYACDLADAQAALQACVNHYQQLPIPDNLNPWAEALERLQTRLQALPAPNKMT